MIEHLQPDTTMFVMRGADEHGCAFGGYGMCALCVVCTTVELFPRVSNVLVVMVPAVPCPHDLPSAL
jgi:hypothetical protein